MIVAQETVSSVPAVRTPKATLRQPLLRAAPLGCPSELRASLLHREVGAGECRQIPSPGPQGYWPCWLPAKALPVLALSHTESRPGHSLQGYKDLALLAQPGLPARASQVQSSPSGQLSLPPRSQVSCFSLPPSLPRRRGSRGRSQCPCCQSPENAARDCSAE